MEEEKQEAVQETAEDKVIQDEKRIERMNEAANRLEAENKRFEENQRLARAEKSLKQAGGFADAGKPQEKKEETPQEYAERMLRGEDDRKTE